MKKGDVIQMRKDIPQGKSLMHGFTTAEKAEQARAGIKQYYNLPESAVTEVHASGGQFEVFAMHATYVVIDARVNWVVDAEAGITYKESGASAVIDLNDAENKGWIVISSAAPVYQSGVEHMSDDELRASIEALRSNRIARPAKVAKARTPRAPREPAMSAQDKALSGVLGKLDPEAKLALQRKLGLID